ncbi:MAG: competence/damage-inducible protein A [Enterococcus sp.]
MKAEIIAVGTELLLGQVVNTNATFLAEELASLGIEVYYQSVVGDNLNRLVEVIQLAETRSELVVLCGGLGPTTDDLTKDALAKHVGKKLIEDPAGLAKLHHYFETSQRELTPNNYQQIMVLEGSQPLSNETGLASGIFYQGSKCQFLLLPGPPKELKPMFFHQVKPLLSQKAMTTEVLHSRVLRFYGIGESQLVTKLADLIDKQSNPTIAPYAKQNEVTLRLTVKTALKANGENLLDALEKKILDRVGTYFYGYGEENSLAQVVVDLLKAQNLTISAAESLTAGAFQASLGAIAGVSTVFPGGFVTYSLASKQTFLQIEGNFLAEVGTVSAACAQKMACQAQKLAQTDYALAFTGVAGPDSLEGQSPGTTFIALAYPGGVKVQEYHFSRGRDHIRHSAVMAGWDLLRRQVLKK